MYQSLSSEVFNNCNVVLKLNSVCTHSQMYGLGTNNFKSPIIPRDLVINRYNIKNKY